jgi:hypothetical protein
MVMKQIRKGAGAVLILSCVGYFSYKIGKDLRDARIECNKLNLK